MRKPGYILTLLFMITSLFVSSQTDLLFNTYNINTIARNPAAIENNGYINAYFGIHQQWIGFEDAPNMQWAHVSNFFDGANMGVSLNIENQSVGASVTQNIKLNYSYHIQFKGGHNLALGLGAGIYHRRFDFSKLRFDEDEQNIPVTDENEIHPDFDFGLEYNYKNFTIGMASNHITIMNSKATVTKIPLQNHVYIGYSADLGNEIFLMPRLDFFNSGTITSYGISADVFYQNKVSAGIAYRTGASLIVRAGVRISSMFYVNYSYDMGAGSFTTYNSGIHEVVLSARFLKQSQSNNSPRFID